MVSETLDCATGWSKTRRETKQHRDPTLQSVVQCPIPWPYAEYLAEALQKASNASSTELSPNKRASETNDACQLLGLAGRNRGRPKGTKTHDGVPLAALYWLAIRKGFRPAEAKKLLQELLQDWATVDRKTIERAAKGYCHLKEHADALLEGIISHASPMYRHAFKALSVRAPGK